MNTATVSSELYRIFSKTSDSVKSTDLKLPTSSAALLRYLILHNAPMKLTDRETFEEALRELSESWEHGQIELGSSGLDETTTVLSVTLNDAKKRKRSVDADNAASSEPSPRITRLNISRSPTVNAELDEIYTLLRKGTTKGQLLASRDCDHARASQTNPSSSRCNKIHFRPIIRPHTDPTLGHCSYLNTCFSEPTYSMSPSIHPLPAAPRPAGAALPSGLGAGGRGKDKAPCRYLHFEVDYDGPNGGDVPMASGTDDKEEMVGGESSEPGEKEPQQQKIPLDARLDVGLGPYGKLSDTYPPQWINCDLRNFDAAALGKFHVIMADPPWDIHMSLPYGTMTDDEMKAMPIPQLQDEGLLFLWVTGRAMELGRECMQAWGYTRIDEVVWVKTNQLQRVIRTGRTGHWLNHTKEHMLVGLKTVLDPQTNELVWPKWLNRGLDTDVIVSEVRETSRKPDEVYGIIERMCPGGRKVEIFGRRHNTRPGWVTLGNQLGQDMIHEPELAARINARYPERAQSNAAMRVDH